jgi:transposase
MSEQEQLPRCKEIDRRQILMRTVDVEELIPGNHPARALWQLTGELDLGEFYAPVKSLTSGPGRS